MQSVLPDELRGRVFSRREARDHGITEGVLRGPKIEAVFAGVYRYAETELTDALTIGAARLVVPADALVCRTTALRLWGLDIAPLRPIHFATNTCLRRREAGIALHRHEGDLTPYLRDGFRLTGPDRTFVDCGTLLPLPQLVAVGDWLVAQGLTSVAALCAYAERSHLDGVQRAREAAALVRRGAESPRESLVRVVLVTWGLPEPLLNVDIHDDAGRFMARGDLVYEGLRVVVEYDGWYHERSAEQRRRDILRREALEAAGWIVIVLTSSDLGNPGRLAQRVFAALKARGYRGPAPQFDSARFGRWMQPNGPITYK